VPQPRRKGTLAFSPQGEEKKKNASLPNISLSEKRRKKGKGRNRGFVWQSKRKTKPVRSVPLEEGKSPQLPLEKGGAARRRRGRKSSEEFLLFREGGGENRGKKIGRKKKRRGGSNRSKGKEKDSLSEHRKGKQACRNGPPKGEKKGLRAAGAERGRGQSVFFFLQGKKGGGNPVPGPLATSINQQLEKGKKHENGFFPSRKRKRGKTNFSN